MAFCTDEYEVMHTAIPPASPSNFMYEVRDSYLTPTRQERDLGVMMV